MGVKHLNKDLNFDASIPMCKMMKWDQQEAGESTKENTTQEENTAAWEHNLPSGILKKRSSAAPRMALFPHVTCNVPKQLRPQSS